MSRSEHRNVCKIFLVFIGLLATNKVHGNNCECACQDLFINTKMCDFFEGINRQVNANNAPLREWIQHSTFLTRFAEQWKHHVGDFGIQDLIETLRIVKENADMAEKFSSINSKLHKVETLAQGNEKRLNEEQKIREKLQEERRKIEDLVETNNRTKRMVDDIKEKLDIVENRTNHLEGKEKELRSQLQNGLTNIPFTLNIKPSALNTPSPLNGKPLNISLDFEGKLNITSTKLNDSLQLHMENSSITDPGTSMHLELELRNTSVAVAILNPCLGGCPQVDAFDDIYYWNETERIKETKKRICENYDYVWYGYIENSTRTNGFAVISFHISKVMKEGIEKASDIEEESRILVIRDNCTITRVFWYRYDYFYILGKDCRNSWNEQHGATRRYILDKTAAVSKVYIPQSGDIYHCEDI